MSFTSLSSKTDGVDNISKAEVSSLADNIAWFRSPPTARVLGDETTTLTTATLTQLTWNLTDGHIEWEHPGTQVIVDPDAPDALYPGDEEPGIWLCGAGVGFANNATGYRRFYLRRSENTDTTTARIADLFVMPPSDGRRCNMNLAGQEVFTATNRQFQPLAAQESGGNLATMAGFQPLRMWCLWIAENSNSTSDFAAARPTSSTSVTTWWNQMRTNQIRLQYRPSAAISQTSDQTLTNNTITKLNLGTLGWETNSFLVSSPNDEIDIQTTGYYYYDCSVSLKAENNGTGRLDAWIYRDAVAFEGVSKPFINSANGDTTVHFSGMDLFVDGEVVSLRARHTKGSNADVRGSDRTRLSMTLVSSNVGVSTGREKFGPIPDTIPDVDNYSSSTLPLGHMQLLSDVTDRLWERPYFELRVRDIGSAALLQNGQGWTTIECDDVLVDFTDVEGLGYTVASDGGFNVPWAGTWLVSGYVAIDAQNEDDANVGDQGYRGCRFALNGKGSVMSVIEEAMNSATLNWSHRWTELFVINKADQVINIQALAGGLTNADLGVPVLDAFIKVVEIGDGVTRDPN